MADQLVRPRCFPSAIALSKPGSDGSHGPVWPPRRYCDNTMVANFPEHGRKVGYAVTCIWGPPRDGFNRVSWIDVLKQLEVNRANNRPSCLIIKQDFPEEYAAKVGLVGGNMANAMKVLGVSGCISDGPIRDLDELRELGMHFHSMGTSSGHGEFGVYAVNVPVNVCGMDVAPGELVHMDENGVCKFPAVRAAPVFPALSTVSTRSCCLRRTSSRRWSRTARSCRARRT